MVVCGSLWWSVVIRSTLWLGYTPQINFCYFFYNLNLVIFWTVLHLESDLPVGGIVFHKNTFSSLKMILKQSGIKNSF